jgi:probable rRNA maturation factor
VLDLTVDRAARGALDGADLGRLRRRIARMVKAAWLSEGGHRELEVALRLTDDATILAFALREGKGGTLHPHLLGDLVISVDTARRQARRRGLSGEILFLAAHGLCHLLGYDHQSDREEAEMNARMASLLVEADRRGPVRPA